FLYLAETQHMAWGYLEVPPFTSLMGWISTSIFGDSIHAVRLFPLIFGSLTMFLALRITKLLGGNKWAIILTGIIMLLSPAFLRTSLLYQPVVFNVFFWTLLTYLLIRLIQTKKATYWYYIGISIGIGFLNKYSILFYALGIFLGLLLTSNRKWLKQKEPYLAAVIALIITSPNLYWQWAHNFPIMNHMAELSETQLVHMNPLIFLTGQILMLLLGCIVWLPGLIGLFTHQSFKDYKIIGFIYLTVIILLLALSGKDYYSMGLYPGLVAFGAVYLGKRLATKRAYLYIVCALLILTYIPMLPLGIPLLPSKNAISYFKTMSNFGMQSALRWEDGEYRALPQDYADMFGWEETVANVAELYHSLPDSIKATTIIEGGGYHHAGPLNYYREKYDLPETYSFSANFLLWLDENSKFENMIYISDNNSTASSFFQEVTLVDSVSNPYARDRGYITFRSKPVEDLGPVWKRLIRERRAFLER
ncbi:MAG: glycosyltransferase family 39 protein, partial [Bacteroidota bacterium]